MARGHTCATWTGRRCRPAALRRRQRGLLSHARARHGRRAPGPGAELGNLVAEEALLRSCELALAGALARRPRVGRPGPGGGAGRDSLRRLVPAGDAERVGIWDGASSQVQRRARDQHAALIEDAGHAIVPGHFAATPGWRVDRQVGRGRPRAPGELARALPSDADAPGATQDAGMRQGGCCSRCWPTPREILPSVLSRQYPTRNPTPTLAVARAAPLPDAPRGFQPDFCTTDLSESASCW